MPSGPFLIGGGREPEQVLPTHRPFVAACGGGPVALVIADEGDGADVERWTAALDGAAEVRPVVLSAGRPIADDDVAGVAGVYVAGGLTPLYAALLAGWAPPPDVVYGGFSAGAAVAARDAIVGGWQAVDGSAAAVCTQDAGEALDPV